MKNFITSVLAILFMFFCGCKMKVDGTELANEVCECRKKGKGLKFADPEAKRIRMECSKLQGENWFKIKKTNQLKMPLTKD